METLVWYWLRLSRSDPFGQAGADEERASLYRAALQQFEELMKAAAATGPPSRPLPLFYALSQAGRAIVAARGSREYKGHGLGIEVRADDTLLDTAILPKGQRRPGQFQAVARGIGSPSLDRPVELGALMASLPELSDELLLETKWPRALTVWPDEGPYAHLRDPEWLPVWVVFDEEVRTPDEVLDVLARYPAAKERAALVSAETQLPNLPRTPTPGGLGVRMLWRDAGGGVNSVFPQYRVMGQRWLRPAVAGLEPPAPLMTWWALLFALSMLARYHPVPWVRALDPDSSPIAVSLERAMAAALDALPHLVFEALLGRPVALPWHDAACPARLRTCGRAREERRRGSTGYWGSRFRPCQDERGGWTSNSCCSPSGVSTSQTRGSTASSASDGSSLRSTAPTGKLGCQAGLCACHRRSPRSGSTLESPASVTEPDRSPALRGS